MKNEAEIETWNGPIGQRWVQFQESMDARIGPFGTAALEKLTLREGMTVLDVGCGCGDLTMAAARLVGATGKAVGLDVSQPMLARAAERTADLANVEFVEHDAATYTAFAPFDAAVSRFGVMFFDDPIGAFANLRAALKPGGMISFACWQALHENPWAAVPLSAMLRVLEPPAPTPPNTPGPFAFAEPKRVASILSDAGFHDIRVEPLVLPIALGSSLDEAVKFATKIGPSARLLRDADKETFPRVMEMLRQTLASAGPRFELDGAVWVVTALA